MSMRPRATLPASASEELGYLLDAYYHMLKDSRLVRGATQRIANERINAEAAVQAARSRARRAWLSTTSAISRVK